MKKGKYIVLAFGCIVILGLVHATMQDRSKDENGHPSGPQVVNERMLLERAYPMQCSIWSPIKRVLLKPFD